MGLTDLIHSIARVDDREVRADGGTAIEEDPSFFGAEFVQSLPFWLPTFLLMAFFVYGAIGWNFVISLTHFHGFILPSYNPATFDLHNFSKLLGDPTFWTAFRNSVILLVCFTVVSLIVGFVLAILVDQKIRFENTFRTIYLLPMALSFVVTAVFWAWMYNLSYGVINFVLRSVGLGVFASDWLGGSLGLGPLASLPFVPHVINFRLFAIIFALIWQFSGYAMVVYLAGLREIPTDHYEAAQVDGASWFRMYRRVILPQLRTSTVSAAVVLMVFGLKGFSFIYALFGAHPGSAADTLGIMVYREAFVNNQWAYGSAVAVVLFLLALVIVGPYLYGEYRRGAL